MSQILPYSTPRLLLAVTAFALSCLQLNPIDAQDAKSARAIVSPDVIFEESNGVLAVEAEHFWQQKKKQVRAWHRHSTIKTADIKPDGDPAHLAGASAGAYLEALPDTRRTHADKLTAGQNFANEAGRMAILHYKVWINNPGRYYVWVRTFSTGTEDNGIHVGIDGTWPESGQRLQWTAKQKWFWDSKQRTQKVHTGVPGKIFLDIKTKGEHVITFSMREDGFEFDKWLMTTDAKLKRPEGTGPETKLKQGKLPKPFPPFKFKKNTNPASQIQTDSIPRRPHGEGAIQITGEFKTWHTLTFTQDGLFATEADQSPNPFRDVKVMTTFRHESGKTYQVRGFFAADGNAANSSATSGTCWRTFFTPDLSGKWSYVHEVSTGQNAGIEQAKSAKRIPFAKPQSGEFTVKPSDKTGRDLRAHGRLSYVGQRYLQFSGSKAYFLKAGADAPETLLGYKDFDGTIARKKNVPLKTYSPHVQDWSKGDPTWKKGKGKGLIGAVNYLSAKGCNAFSFLTYNAGGDGDNVWPYISRNDKLHFDVSKLDQWNIVFQHATQKGMYLHFKLQETENDDNNKKNSGGNVPVSLDGGELGTERKVYLKELIARFGHHLALNWNLGEENTQSTKQQKEMAKYIKEIDPYDNLIVVHTYPDQQDKVYRPLLGNKSVLRGASLQNSHIRDTHKQVIKWVAASAETGTPWIIAFDESGSAAHGQCPDLGYKGFDGKDADGKYVYTQHDVRRQTLWGTLMAGGAGVEYYFGYKFAENDLKCEDWRSRDQSWDYCRIAIEFFQQQGIPFWQMKNENSLVGNSKNDNSAYCLAKPGECYVVFLASDKSKIRLELKPNSKGYQGQWFNPRIGKLGETVSIQAESKSVALTPPSKDGSDWVFVVKSNK